MTKQNPKYRTRADFPASDTELEREIFAVVLGDATRRVKDGALPKWLDEIRGNDVFDDLVEEYHLGADSRDRLIAIALALDQCLAMPAEQLDRVSGTQLRSLREQISALIDSVRNLKPLLPPDLNVGLDEGVSRTDGSIAFDVGPGITDRVDGVLQEFDHALAEVRTRVGRRTGFPHVAHLALMAMLDELQPTMSNSHRAELAERLFADVLRQHGHQSRAELADRGDTPRSRDMVRRVARPARDTKRKSPRKSR